MRYIGRFAPSPTGPLHFGSLVAALASYLDARAHGGQWLMRIEDVDTPRTVAGAEAEILRALEAFGFEWDGPIVRQGSRTARYAQALDRLRAAGLVYRCRCSRREIADSALAGVEGPVYPGTCAHLALAEDVEGADRVRVPEREIGFDDRVMGRVTQNLARQVGDFVLRRRHGLFAYQLAVVVDDADQGVTHVVRGADLLLSTPRQVFLQDALGLATPAYLHIPVATNARGEKLSKQTQAAPLDPRRRPREALRSALAFLGQQVPDQDEPAALLRQAVTDWNAARIPTARDRPLL